MKYRFWRYYLSVKKKCTTFGKTIYGKINDKYFICYEKYFTASMQEFLCAPDRYLDSSPHFFFKSTASDTTTVGMVVLDGKEFVVKRYNIKSFSHFLRKFWRQSNATRTWKNTHYLQQVGISTLTPVAVVEQRIAGLLRGKAYFISEYVNGVCGVDYFAAKNKPTLQWQKVMQNIVAMMQQMYQAKIEHHDLQWCNILIVDDQPLLLDLDHMKVHKRNNGLYRRVWRRDVEHFKELLAASPIAYKMFCDLYNGYE